MYSLRTIQRNSVRIHYTMCITYQSLNLHFLQVKHLQSLNCGIDSPLSHLPAHLLYLQVVYDHQVDCQVSSNLQWSFRFYQMISYLPQLAFLWNEHFLAWFCKKSKMNPDSINNNNSFLHFIDLFSMIVSLQLFWYLMFNSPAWKLVWQLLYPGSLTYSTAK